MRKSFLATLVCLFAVSVFAEEPPSPQSLWGDLMKGNELYVQGQVVYGNLPSMRALWAKGQNPPVSILSCADSRVPAEIAFARTVGELFVVRVAGNVEDAFNIASLEYAVKEGWTKEIVVMGHSSCGAVEAAIKNPIPPPTPALGLLIRRIRWSFTTEKPDLEQATIDNVCFTRAQLRDWSVTLRNATIRMAYFNIETGRVSEITPGMCKEKSKFEVCGLRPPS